MSFGVGRRQVSNLTLLWLWRGLAAVALIQPLAWELPYATDVALKSKKKKGVPVMAQWLPNLTRKYEVAGSIPGPAQWVNDPALP